jgi:hypothetical protein
MKEEKNNQGERGITRFSKEAERTFFFYATLVMFAFYLILRLLG